MGGLSLSFWKHVRSTQDVDLLIDPGTAGVEAILEVLQQARVRTKRQPPVIDLGSVRIVQLLYEPKDAFMEIQIDLLLAESTFHREALARRVPADPFDVVESRGQYLVIEGVRERRRHQVPCRRLRPVAASKKW